MSRWGDINLEIITNKSELKYFLNKKKDFDTTMKLKGEQKMYVKSKVNYFDVKEMDIVEVVEFVKAHTEERKDGDHIEQKLDIYKVVLPNSTKVHYLYDFEVEK